MKHKPPKLISQPPTQRHITYKTDSGFQSHVRCKYTYCNQLPNLEKNLKHKEIKLYHHTNNAMTQTYQYGRKPYQYRQNADLAAYLIEFQGRMDNTLHKVQHQSFKYYYLTDLKLTQEIVEKNSILSFYTLKRFQN